MPSTAVTSTEQRSLFSDSNTPIANAPASPILKLVEVETKSQTYFDNQVARSSSSSLSPENEFNEAREKELDRLMTPKFLAVLAEEDFEFGLESPTENLIRDLLKTNRAVTKDWLNILFLKYWTTDVAVVVGILRLLGRFDEIELGAMGKTIALAALSHKNDEIKDLGIRAFENWISVDSVNILKETDTNTEWLDNYRRQVISDLESQLCLS